MTTLRIMCVVAVLLLVLVQAASPSSEITSIFVDPFSGSVNVVHGEATAPLYESTMQLETRYIVGGLLSNAVKRVGPKLTKNEVPSLGDSAFQFWQNVCCSASSWSCATRRQALRFGVTVWDTRDAGRPLMEHSLLHIPHHILYGIGYCDAIGIRGPGKRAFVAQIGQLKLLVVIRGVYLAVPFFRCPSGADFVVDLWVAIYPAGTDLILAANRWRQWP